MKSLAMLAVTLFVGFALGLFADATLVRGRRERIGQIQGPPGFVAHMENVIVPHSDAQRDSIRIVLERAAQHNSEVLRGSRERLRAALDSMRRTLAPMLDTEQRDRIARELDHMPDPFGRGRGGPPGPGGFGRGGPPFGRRGGPPPD
jgi:uncharacterized membrane protein